MKVEIAGIEATVVSEAEAEECDAVVCVLKSQPSIFADDVFAPCAHCGVELRHRPHAPKRPPKLCFDCVLDASRGGRA